MLSLRLADKPGNIENLRVACISWSPWQPLELDSHISRPCLCGYPIVFTANCVSRSVRCCLALYLSNLVPRASWGNVLGTRLDNAAAQRVMSKFQKSYFRNEAKCETFVVKMSFIRPITKTESGERENIDGNKT